MFSVENLKYLIQQLKEKFALKSDIPTDYLTEIPSEYITDTELNSRLQTYTPTNANSVDGYSVWVGTQTEYNSISNKSNTTIYFIKEG